LLLTRIHPEWIPTRLTGQTSVLSTETSPANTLHLSR
jgi:hypothetical protein